MVNSFGWWRITKYKYTLQLKIQHTPKRVYAASLLFNHSRYTIQTCLQVTLLLICTRCRDLYGHFLFYFTKAGMLVVLSGENKNLQKNWASFRKYFQFFWKEESYFRRIPKTSEVLLHSSERMTNISEKKRNLSGIKYILPKEWSIFPKGRATFQKSCSSFRK